MSAVLEGTSSNNAEDESVLLAEIEELKKKRPRALTEEQKTDILVAYRSLQVEDLKRKKMRPGRKGNYQRRVSSVVGYSSKTVGLTYRDWNRKHEIKVAVAAANRKPKRQRIPKSKHVLLSVRALVRQRRANSERVVARHILDLMRERSWIDVDETDRKMFASTLRCVQRYLSRHGFSRGDSATVPIQETAAIREARIQYLQRLIDNESLPPEQQLRIVDLDESYIHHHYRRHNDSLFDPNDADFRQPRTQKKGKRLCFVAAITKSNPFIRQAPTGAASVDDKAGLVPNSVWIFQSQKSSGDYHQNFNGTNFVHWFKTQLLPNLSQPSLIRLDNAKYHHTKPVTTPSGYRLKKAELQQVLTVSGIPFAAKDTVATLRKKLKAYVDTVEPEVVQLAKQQGHEVLYTPPYHCDLQPIEMVWSQVKGEVGRQYDLSTTMTIVKQRLEAAFEHLNADTTGRIENLYAHVRKIEKEYMEADDNEEYSNSEDDAASDMSDSDVESVEDQEGTSHSESSSSSDDVDSESDTDEM